MNNKTPQEFCDTVSQLIADGWTIMVVVVSDINGALHRRPMQVLSIRMRGDQYEVVLVGYGVCGIEMGSVFTMTSPKSLTLVQ